jgi:signal transduction histidine kinase
VSTRQEGAWTTDRPRFSLGRGPAEHLTPFHSGQVIAYSRFLFAGFALIAIYIDPTQPARHTNVAYIVLAAYVAYAGIVAILSNFAAARTRRAILEHALDVVVLSILLYLTEGPTSPFFVFFTFAIVSGALRWGSTGAGVTAAVLFVGFLAFSYRDFVTFHDVAPYTVIVKASYILVATVMLAYFGTYRERSHRRLARLARWPENGDDEEPEPSLSGALSHAALILEAEDILVVWEDRAKPEYRATYWNGRTCETRPWSGDPSGRLVAAELSGASFMATSPLSRRAALASGTRRMDEPLVDPDLARAYDVRWFATAPFEGTRYRGRIFVIGPHPLTTDLLSLTEIVAGRIGTELESFGLRRELAEAAAAHERERLARDMHDSILQELTATGLRLRNMSFDMPSEARQSLEVGIELVEAQQKRIREFVAEMNPRPGRQADVDLDRAIGQLTDELATQWQCRIIKDVGPVDATCSEELLRQLRFILTESIANAVRHSKASEVRIALEVDGGRMKITVRDHGSRLMAQSEPAPTDSIGPHSLRQRVAELGGSCRMTTDRAGTTLSIDLPLK